MHAQTRGKIAGGGNTWLAVKTGFPAKRGVLDPPFDFCLPHSNFDSHPGNRPYATRPVQRWSGNQDSTTPSTTHFRCCQHFVDTMVQLCPQSAAVGERGVEWHRARGTFAGRLEVGTGVRGTAGVGRWLRREFMCVCSRSNTATHLQPPQRSVTPSPTSLIRTHPQEFGAPGASR